MSKPLEFRHSRAGGNPPRQTSREADKPIVPPRGDFFNNWIPACAGMTGRGVL